ATIYIKFEYTKGTITEVPEYVGKQALKENKSVPILEKTESNDAYEVSIMNPGLLGIELMKTVENELKPDSENALITFIRPEKFIKDVPFGIWGEDGYLGTLRGNTYFRVSVKPGKHIFVAKSEKYSVVEADVEAGKEYYIQLKAKVGMFLAGVQMMPVNKVTKDIELQGWLKSSTEITFDRELVTDDVVSLMERARPILDDVLKKVEKGEIKPVKLSVEIR
ncbi:MAG TPA: hypothetical protein VHR47_05295, partial [Bacillota bacterium]|nr:hypothetical protein [Bacillota bacterium]